MTIAIIGSIKQFDAFKLHFIGGELFHFETITELNNRFDLLFDFNYQNTETYNEALSKTANHIFVNAVIDNKTSFNRFNGWHTFYEKLPLELIVKDERSNQTLEQLQISYKNIPDIIGMITPRVVSMIVNEAFFALGENVSTEAEIDTAMKLGTNYPYGPFEWSRLIGLDNIHDLLLALSKKNERYAPAPAMLKALNN